MICHYRQRILTAGKWYSTPHDRYTLIEQVTEFNFLGLTANTFMNWNSHTQKIANKISRTLGVMNRLKRYLPISAMKLMYDSLILSYLQFGITNWGFERDRISKLQKRALRIMTNSRYNAHTEPLFKQLHLLKVKDIFDVQCPKFWYKFVNNELPNYFRNMFTYNHDLHDFETRNRDRLHLYQTRTSGARNVLRNHLRNYWIDFPSIWLTKWRRIVCILLPTILNFTWLIYIVMTAMKSTAIFATKTDHDNRRSKDSGIVGGLWSLAAVQYSWCELWLGVFAMVMFPHRL